MKYRTSQRTTDPLVIRFCDSSATAAMKTPPRSCDEYGGRTINAHATCSFVTFRACVACLTTSAHLVASTTGRQTPACARPLDLRRLCHLPLRAAKRSLPRSRRARQGCARRRRHSATKTVRHSRRPRPRSRARSGSWHRVWLPQRSERFLRMASQRRRWQQPRRQFRRWQRPSYPAPTRHG